MNLRPTKLIFMIGLTFIILATGPFAMARTSLVVLPARDTAVLRLAKGIPTLVQENRILTLSKGINPVDFSWQGVAIDPASIILTPLTGPNDARLLSVSYPPGENALVWEVYSSKDRELPVVISYLLQGIDHLVTHEALADANETRMTLTSRLVLRNFSGEDFDAARLYLDPETQFASRSKTQETRQILFFEKSDIPIEKIYLWDSRTMAHVADPDGPVPGIPMGYKIRNTSKAGLGQRNLSGGKTRVFQQDSQATTIFLGENRMDPVPVGDHTLLILGDSRDIQVTLRRMKTRKTRIRKNEKGKIQVYDEEIKDKFVVENFKSAPAVLTLRHAIPGQWEPVEMGYAYTLKDHATLEFEIHLAPGEKKTIPLSYKRLNLFAGSFSRYNRY